VVRCHICFLSLYILRCDIVAHLFLEYLVRVEGRSHNEALKSGSFFGEEVLGKATKYTATVVALQTTSCFRLNLHTLDQITGEKST